MTNHGTYRIHLTGSRSYIRRCVYEDDQKKTWIKWYGTYIEVKRSWSDYYTVEPY